MSGTTEGAPTLTVWSRNGRDVTGSFPELTGLADGLAVDAVLDGEAVVFDGEQPSFHRLQHRMHVSNPSAAAVAEHPVVLMVFDLLELDGHELLALPYHQRRRLLTDLVDEGVSWRVPPAVEGDGAALLELARRRGLEGVVAKRRSSPYRTSGRHGDWLKVKLRQEQELVVGGWLPGQGQLDGRIGSLLVGTHDGEALVFAGAVGSGISERDRALLTERLVEVDECPFVERPSLDRSPVWVAPTSVVQVGYGSWPADGLLRHPTYLGLLPDHDPSQVVRELPPSSEVAR